MSDGLTATHGVNKVRKLQRALSRTSQQDKKQRFYRLYDKVWRAAVLWEAWRQGKANKGAPGGDGLAIETVVNAGQEEEMSTKRQQALREHRSQCAPVRVVEMPKPKGGTRPLGIATGADRVVQPAMRLVVEPLFAADCHDCSYGDRPKREAKQASKARRDDLYPRAWGVVAVDFKAYCPSIPPPKLMQLIPQRIADGRLRALIKQTLQVGMYEQGQVVPTKVGVPQGAPISPLYSNSSLNLLEQLWPRRGSPETLGATRHRYADDAMLVCRKSPQPVVAAWAASATRMDLTRKRAKTHGTRVTDGFDCLGVNFVQRQSPRSGKNTIDIFPAKSAPQKMRSRLQ